MRLLLRGAIALLLSPLVAQSQEPPAVVPGARIRITQLGPGPRAPRSGTVFTAGVDTVALKLDRGGATVPIPLASISRLEVSQGRKRRTAAGIAWGFLLGFSAGALLGAVDCKSHFSCSGGSDGDWTPLEALVVGGIGGGAGMIVGGVVGARHTTEKWESAPSSRWRVSAGRPGPGYFTFALSARFWRSR